MRHVTDNSVSFAVNMTPIKRLQIEKLIASDWIVRFRFSKPEHVEHEIGIEVNLIVTVAPTVEILPGLYENFLTL